MNSQSETLTTISSVEIWQVKDGLEEKLTVDEWRIYMEASVVFSKVGSVVWKLDTNLHVLKPSDKSYVFAINPTESLFYCVNLPEDVSSEDILVLEETLRLFVTFEETLEVVKNRTDKFIAGVGKTTEMALNGMNTAAKYINDQIQKRAENYISQSAPCENPKPIAKVAAGFAGAAVEAVSVATSRAADTILASIPHGDPNKTASKAARVTAVVIVSATEIYDGMVEAFVAVSKQAGKATKSVITHKYGEDVGQVTGDSLAAVGHSANAFVQSTRLGTKAILKTAAKQTAASFAKQNAIAPATHTAESS